MYKVTIDDQDEGKGAWHTDPYFPAAIYEAAVSTRIYAKRALAIGLVAMAVFDEAFEGEEERMLVDFLKACNPPTILQRHVKLAIEDWEGRNDE